MHIVPRILQDFHEPHFLNAQIDSSSTKTSGDTALHIAARQGCIDVIFRILSGLYGSCFDTGLLNTRKETFLDLCIVHYESLINELEDLFMALGTLYTETATAKKLERLEAVIPLLLNDQKCEISAFSLVVLRQTDISFLFTLPPNVQFHVAIAHSEYFQIPPFVSTYSPICTNQYIFVFSLRRKHSRMPRAIFGR